MFYVFHGDDEFSRAEAIARLRHEMDPVVGELNTTFFDGRDLSMSALRAACDTVPFMTGVRLVIVRDLISSAGGGKGSRSERSEPVGDADRLRDLESYLPQLPESTRLVFDESRSLPDKHPLLRLAVSSGAYVRAFTVPKGTELEQWIGERARKKGVSIAREAISLLANYVGSNLRLLDQELEKLATYLGGQGTIGVRDVELLVSSVQEANIFHMVDALGARDGRRALQLLHRLLGEGKAPLYLLTMIVRQFRLLLLARELDALGTPAAEMARQMDVKPFAVGKLLQQATRFRPSDLKAILGQLLDIDVGIKTGQVDGPLALELFVTRWAGR